MLFGVERENLKAHLCALEAVKSSYPFDPDAPVFKSDLASTDLTHRPSHHLNLHLQLDSVLICCLRFLSVWQEWS